MIGFRKAFVDFIPKSNLSMITFFSGETSFIKLNKSQRSLSLGFLQMQTKLELKVFMTIKSIKDLESVFLHRTFFYQTDNALASNPKRQL
jgi:hypothetical protein